MATKKFDQYMENTHMASTIYLSIGKMLVCEEKVLHYYLLKNSTIRSSGVKSVEEMQKSGRGLEQNQVGSAIRKTLHF